MATHPDYPRVSSKVDRHGVTRWRYMDGKRPMLPGEPHSAEFDAAYDVLIGGGRVLPKAVATLPAKAKPAKVEPTATVQIIQFTGRTLDSAWAMLRKKREYKWSTLELNSQRIYSKTIERILDLTVEGSGNRYGGGKLADLQRRHVKDILGTFRTDEDDRDSKADTPHMERTALLCLRKLIKVGFEEEWITQDPTYGMARNPETDGHATWSAGHLDQYERHWPLGSPQRVAYALALWLGNRVSDVARLRWEHLVTEEIMSDGKLKKVVGFRFKQFKGRKIKKKGRPANGTVFLPMTPMLESELVGHRRESGPVLLSPVGRGYTDSRLSTQVSKWAKQAGIPDGYTCHGLRKALGVKLAHADSSTRAIMTMLGHTSPAMVQVYTAEVEDVRMAMMSADKLTAMETAKGWTPTPKLRVVKS